jgi:hypothetical protein
MKGKESGFLLVFGLFEQKAVMLDLKKEAINGIFIVIVPLCQEVKRGSLKSFFRQVGLTGDAPEAVLPKFYRVLDSSLTTFFRNNLSCSRKR